MHPQVRGNLLTGGVRRRARAPAPRRRQVVVRFSTAELGLIRERAAIGGLAVGAWVGRPRSRRRRAAPADRSGFRICCGCMLTLSSSGRPVRPASKLPSAWRVSSRGLMRDRSGCGGVRAGQSVITKVVHGWRVGGQIAYLRGPGRAQEHVRSRVIASGMRVGSRSRPGRGSSIGIWGR
jgi:hypothetical protein